MVLDCFKTLQLLTGVVAAANDLVSDCVINVRASCCRTADGDNVMILQRVKRDQVPILTMESMELNYVLVNNTSSLNDSVSVKTSIELQQNSDRKITANFNSTTLPEVENTSFNNNSGQESSFEKTFDTAISMINNNETREGTTIVKQLVEIICQLLTRKSRLDSVDSGLKEKISVLSQVSKSLKNSSAAESSG